MNITHGYNEAVGHWLTVKAFGYRLRLRQKARPLFGRVPEPSYQSLDGVEVDTGGYSDKPVPAGWRRRD